MDGSEHRGWYKYGTLPHFDGAGLYQSITYRLDDSLPRHVVAALERELRRRPGARAAREALRRRRIDELLDAGHGSCILMRSANARLVMDAWRHYDGERYDLVAGVVMPNHVHVLVHVHPGTRLGQLVASWKSFTSRKFEADHRLDGEPRWQRGYWDRFVRDEAHFRNTVRYIAFNPVKAGLVRAPGDWPHLVFGTWLSVAAE